MIGSQYLQILFLSSDLSIRFNSWVSNLEMNRDVCFIPHKSSITFWELKGNLGMQFFNFLLDWDLLLLPLLLSGCASVLCLWPMNSYCYSRYSYRGLLGPTSGLPLICWPLILFTATTLGRLWPALARLSPDLGPLEGPHKYLRNLNIVEGIHMVQHFFC
jgi:hypothetical protein